MLQVRKNQGLIPSLFNELMDWPYIPAEEQSAMPKMNVSENNDGYELDLCVPGLAKEDLSLSIDSENNLVVEMVRKEEQTEKKEGTRILRHEFSQMHFKQLLSLPENVKKEAISAQVENGILHITLPKYTEQEKLDLSHRIEIQ